MGYKIYVGSYLGIVGLGIISVSFLTLIHINNESFALRFPSEFHEDSHLIRFMTLFLNIDRKYEF
jgi:hypothetical protein